MTNGGWGPIEYTINRIHSFDIWALALGFECCRVGHATMKHYLFVKLFPGHNTGYWLSRKALFQLSFLLIFRFDSTTGDQWGISEAARVREEALELFKKFFVPSRKILVKVIT